jgi:hypothetical protein
VSDEDEAISAGSSAACGSTGKMKVTAARHGFREPRLFGGVAERRTQPVHGGADAVFELDDGSVGSELLVQFLPSDDFTRPLQQHGKDLERLVGDPDPRPAFGQLQRLHVQPERPKLEGPRAPTRGHWRSLSIIHRAGTSDQVVPEWKVWVSERF